MCVLAVARSGGHRRCDGCLATTRRPAGDDLPRAARPDRQGGSARGDIRRDDGAYCRRQPRQGRDHAYRQTRQGRHAFDRDCRGRTAGGGGPGDGRKTQGPGPRHGGQLRRRRHQHRLLSRGGQYGRALGPATGLRLPEQPLRRNDADLRHHEARTCRRTGCRIRHAGCSGGRQRSAGGEIRARRSTAAGARRRRAHLHRMRDVPLPRSLLR